MKKTMRSMRSTDNDNAGVFGSLVDNEKGSDIDRDKHSETDSDNDNKNGGLVGGCMEVD